MANAGHVGRLKRSGSGPTLGPEKNQQKFRYLTEWEDFAWSKPLAEGCSKMISLRFSSANLEHEEEEGKTEEDR